jgi:hypothetical protein
MGLEAPLALLGLLGALLPWLAHRIRRRDLQPRPLPTFALLQRAEAHKRRSRGITDLLLLLLRIAIVIVGTLALTAPFVTARLTFGDGTVASAAIVIDDSMSMTREERGDSLLAQAVERAQQALASLPAGSEVALIAAGEQPRVLVRRSNDPRAVELALNALPPVSMRGSNLRAALGLAAQQLQGARHPTLRLLVLSDFAAHAKLRPEDVRLDGIQVRLERVGSSAPATNLWFAALQAVPDPTAKGQSSLSIELVADGEVAGKVPISVQSGGREVARAEVAIEARRGHALVHVPEPAADADPTALVRIEAVDALDADNVAGVLLRSSDALQVMLVNGDPHPASSRDELYYAQNALRLAPEAQGAFALRTVDASGLAKYELGQTDVIVLANAPVPDPVIAERLIRFVRQGGGLIVAGGEKVDARAYNTRLGEALPCRIRSRTLGEPVAFVEPPAPGLLPPGPSGLAQVRTRGRLLLECDSEAPLRFADGAPALAIAARGSGHSALLATTLDADWTDLPLRPGYLPLLAQIVRRVANAGTSVRGPVSAGAPLTLGVPPHASTIEIVAPDGERHRFDDVSSKAAIELQHTERPGPYRMLAASARGALAEVPRGAFVVTPPQGESDLTPLTDVEQWPERARERAHEAALIRRSLAPHLLLLFALLALAEGVARLWKR